MSASRRGDLLLAAWAVPVCCCAGAALFFLPAWLLAILVLAWFGLFVAMEMDP